MSARTQAQVQESMLTLGNTRDCTRYRKFDSRQWLHLSALASIPKTWLTGILSQRFCCHFSQNSTKLIPKLAPLLIYKMLLEHHDEDVIRII